MHAPDEGMSCVSTFFGPGVEEAGENFGMEGAVLGRIRKEDSVAAEKFSVCDFGIFGRWNVAEDVNVIGHDAVCENIDSAKVGDPLHHGLKDGFFMVAEEVFACNDASYAVVEKFLFSRGDPSFAIHDD